MPAVDDPLSLFARLDSGVWKCLKTGQFRGPDGLRIQVGAGDEFHHGKPLRGIDIAAWLDEQLNS